MNGEDETNGEGGAFHPPSGGGDNSYPSPSQADGGGSSAPQPTPMIPISDQGHPIGIGDVLNGIYRITDSIARGRTGNVYEGINIHLAGERVAIKVLRPSLGTDDSGIAILVNSVSKLTQLRHEAIVNYRLVARDQQGRPFIVAEYVDGSSLAHRLDRMRLTDEQFGDIAVRLAKGLGAAHALGVMHLNIAPDNVLLVQSDPQRPKIVGFELAMLPVADDIAGKLKYIAPEQLGEYAGMVGPWTDVYSLALALLAVASGRHPDMGDSIAGAVRKRMSIPDLAAIPTFYRPVFECALQPDPERRPQSMDEFVVLLLEANERIPGSSSKREGSPHVLATVAHERKIGESRDDRQEKSLGGFPSGKWTIIGGVTAFVAALAASVTFLVKLGGGESDDTRAGRPAEEFTALATQVAEKPACSWLNFDGANGSVFRFVGAAGNPESATSALAEGFAATGTAKAALETGEVVAFDGAMCGAIDALRAYRSSDRLITLPQRSFEAEDRDMILGEGINLGQGGWARPLIRVRGLEPEENLVLIVIEADTGMQPLFNGRENGKEIVKLLSGTALADGFEVPYPVKLERPPRETFGVAVIVGEGPFPVDLFGDSSQERPKVPLDASWPDRFRAQALARGWRTDIFWFSVADEIPG